MSSKKLHHIFSLKQRLDLFEKFGNHSLSLSLLQPNMQFFDMEGVGFIAYRLYSREIFVLGNPLCSELDYEQILFAFLQYFPYSSFVHISKKIVDILHAQFGFYGTLCGYEPIVSLSQWHISGKKKNTIRTACNHAEKKSIKISEECLKKIDLNHLENFSQSWLKTRRLKKREIQFLIRPINMQFIQGNERLFCAYQEDQLIGYVLFDPIFFQGKVIGYCPNISRSSLKFKAGIWYVLMATAIEQFKREGVEQVALGIVPFFEKASLEKHESYLLRKTIGSLYRYGNHFYHFKGLHFSKMRFGGKLEKLYYSHRKVFPLKSLIRLSRLAGFL